MVRTRNISIGVPADLHARYAGLGLAARRAVLAEIRRLLENRLQPAAPLECGGDTLARTSQEMQLPQSGVTKEEGTAPRIGMPGDVGAPVALPAGW
jgi:hypothetical protein